MEKLRPQETPQHARDHCRGGQHPGLFGGVHQPDGRARGHGPADRPAAQIPPGAADGREGEEHQQHLVDVVARVEDHRRRHGGQHAGDNRRAAAQAVGHQQQQKHHARAKEHGHDAIRRFAAFGERPARR